MVDLEADRSCRIARYAAALAALGLAFNTITTITGPPMPIEFIAVAVCTAVFVWLWSIRRRPSTRIGNLAFLGVNLVVIVTLWFDAHRAAVAGIAWVPFRPNQLGALAVALFAPEVWIGIPTILGFTLTAVVEFTRFDPITRTHLAYGDPWATLAFGGFAIGLLLFRHRTMRRERSLVEMQVELAAFGEIARYALTIRDLANTPLQTLTWCIDLMRSGRVPASEIAPFVERAVSRLRSLERMVGESAHALTWSPDDLTPSAEPLIGARDEPGLPR